MLYRNAHHLRAQAAARAERDAADRNAWPEYLQEIGRRMFGPELQAAAERLQALRGPALERELRLWEIRLARAKDATAQALDAPTSLQEMVGDVPLVMARTAAMRKAASSATHRRQEAADAA